MKDQRYYVVWEKSKKRARAYVRKMDAIYDHVRFRRKQKVWFLDGVTDEQMKERLGDSKLRIIGGRAGV